MKHVLLTAVVLSAYPAHAFDSFIGKPEYRISGTEKKNLSQAEQSEYMINLNSTPESNYVWSSRGGVKLQEQNSGVFQVLMSRSGMVVLTYCKDDKDDFDFNSTCRQYGEHIRNGLGMISYYGKGTIIEDTP